MKDGNVGVVLGFRARGSLLIPSIQPRVTSRGQGLGLGFTWRPMGLSNYA